MVHIHTEENSLAFQGFLEQRGQVACLYTVAETEDALRPKTTMLPMQKSLLPLHKRHTAL